MKTLVIAAMGRSGSTMIAETVAKHPAIMGFGEVFNHEANIRNDQHASVAGDGGAFVYHPGAYSRPDLYVDLLGSMAAFRGKAVLSFKLMESQCPQLVPMLASRRAYIVHCYRANFIAAVASWKLAQVTGVWHARDKEARARKLGGNSPRVTVNPSEVENWGNRHNAFKALLASTGLPIHPAPYVHTRENPEEAIRGIFDLIEVAPALIDPAQVRVNLRSLGEVVANIGELRKHYDGTSFAWMTRDKENQ